MIEKLPAIVVTISSHLMSEKVCIAQQLEMDSVGEGFNYELIILEWLKEMLGMEKERVVLE